jgi:hypothetical protein
MPILRKRPAEQALAIHNHKGFFFVLNFSHRVHWPTIKPHRLFFDLLDLLLLKSASPHPPICQYQSHQPTLEQKKQGAREGEGRCYRTGTGYYRSICDGAECSGSAECGVVVPYVLRTRM